MPSHIYIHPLEVVTSSLLPSLVWEPQWLPIVLEIIPKLLMLAFNTLCNLVPLTTSTILIVLFTPDILMFLFLKHTKFFLFQDAYTFLFSTWNILSPIFIWLAPYHSGFSSNVTFLKGPSQIKSVNTLHYSNINLFYFLHSTGLSFPPERKFFESKFFTPFCFLVLLWI